MISGIFHKGSGVGNQLHRYVATRVLALDKGCEFSMVAPELCKVADFMNLDMGKENNLSWHCQMPEGKVIVDENHRLWEEKTNYYNPEFNFTEDNTIIDGEFQDERYFGHRLKEIDEWLKVDKLIMDDELCVIGFRGGEFAQFPDLFLTREYWTMALLEINKINPYMKFEVHTDDEALAKQFFPIFNVVYNPSYNWRAMRYAKYAIIANSSFYILPRLLNGGVTIAPRYWARRNTKEWSMPQNYYKNFTYI